MKALNRDEVLSVNDMKIEPAPMPEWGDGVGVYVRGLTGMERDEWDNRSFRVEDGRVMARENKNAIAFFCSMVICDESGARLFSESDAEALGERSSEALLRIFRIGQRLSGLGEAVVDLEKNSSGQSESSGTN
jgi:hypothetical protein